MKVVVPLAAPGLAVTAIVSWVFAWNEYLFAASLTSVEARTISTGDALCRDIHSAFCCHDQISSFSGYYCALGLIKSANFLRSV